MGNKAKEIAESILKEVCSVDETGSYYIEFYADYRDELNDEDIIKILSCSTEELALDTLRELLWDAYDEDRWGMLNSVCGKIESALEDAGVESDFDVSDFVYDRVYTEYPTHHFLRQDVYMNLIIDTGDGNYDFTMNNLLEDGRTLEDFLQYSSMVWLMRQQGVSEGVIKTLITTGEHPKTPFLNSVYTECLNVSGSMNALVFCYRTSLGEALKMKNKDSITLPAEVGGGLVDFWNGGGSVLELSLERDLAVPSEFIRSALPDGADGSYGIGNIYGMSRSFWREI